MKKRLFCVLLVAVAASAIAGFFDPAPDRAKWWARAGIISGNVGFAPHVSASGLNLAAGFSPPWGFGIGTSAVENLTPRFDGDVAAVGFAPVSVYYVPYARWNRYGLPIPLVYGRATLSAWLQNAPAGGYYLRAGGGAAFVNAELEAGYYSYRCYDMLGGIVQEASPYVSLGLSLGSWVGFVFRKTPTRPMAEQGVVAQANRVPKLSFDYRLLDEDRDGILTGGERVTLEVSVANRGDGEARDVRVTLSGTSTALTYLGRETVLGRIAAGDSADASFACVLPQNMKSGAGSIVVSVTEGRGFNALEETELRVATKPATVERRIEVISENVDVDEALKASGFRREDAYAVVVGISEYRAGSIPAVKYAERDAESVRDYLIKVCGFLEPNVISLQGSKATKSDLEAYCEEWLTRNVRKGSFVFVYFAGHGTPSPDKGEAYIVPYDGEPGFVSKLYPLSRLYSSLAALPTDQVVVALDACFSGAGGRSVMEQGKRPLVAVDLEKEAQKLGNVAVLTASAGNEISQDYDVKRHGLFTYYLLKGLRGEADADKDGWVTVKELHSYVSPKVADESRRLGYTQSPQLLPQPTSARADVRLARVR